MIKLTSFYPFGGFTRVTQEFYEGKFVVTQKSPTSEREEEFSYNKVARIADSFMSTTSQLLFGLMSLFIIGVVIILFSNTISENILLLQSARILFVVAIIIFITGFIKRWYIHILDIDNNNLAVILQTKKNREAILSANEMIRKKSETVKEISITDPFPSDKPKFEFVYYDYSNLYKSIDRFFDNEIIGYQKHFLVERIFSVDPATLNGKLHKGKMGINIVGLIGIIGMLYFSILFGISGAFNPIPRIVFTDSLYIFLTALILSNALKFIKRDVIGFYNKNGNVAYYAFVKPSDKEKFDRIIEFIQSRIPTENKEASLKEQA